MCSRRSSVRRVSFSPAISWPPMRMLPEVGESSPAAQCISVLLPDPEGPITARNVPCSTASDTSSRACTPPAYVLLTFASAMAGAVRVSVGWPAPAGTPLIAGPAGGG